MVRIVREEVFIEPQAGKQRMFDECLADICIYGGAAGSGKSHGLLIEPLKYIHIPDFRAVYIRRTMPEITQAGGLWDEASKIYPLLGGRGISHHGELRYVFPSGAFVSFRHMQHEKTKFSFQGGQFALIMFDELTHFTETQFTYLWSRARSKCGVRPYIRGTCNPDADSFVADMVDWWIDPDTGYPIEERAGLWRYVARHQGEMVWGDTAEELKAQFPECLPKSFTFIPAKLEDNPALIAADPEYRGNLRALNKVDNERLERGNWHIRRLDNAEWDDFYFDGLYDESHRWPRQDMYLSAMAIDPSKGDEQGSSRTREERKSDPDDSAVVFTGQVGLGKIFVDADIKVRPAIELAEAAVAMYLEHQPDFCVLEGNANQDLAFKTLMNQVCDRWGVPYIPVHTFINQTKKTRRIYKIGPYIKDRMFRFRDNSGCRRLEDQLRHFPLPYKDDGPDALEMALRMMFMHVEDQLGIAEE